MDMMTQMVLLYQMQLMTASKPVAPVATKSAKPASTSVMTHKETAALKARSKKERRDNPFPFFAE